MKILIFAKTSKSNPGWKIVEKEMESKAITTYDQLDDCSNNESLHEEVHKNFNIPEDEKIIELKVGIPSKEFYKYAAWYRSKNMPFIK